MLNVLKGKRLYLSGPIEFGDHSLNWRIEPKKVLAERYGLEIFDPFEDPKQNKVDELDAACEAEDWDTVEDITEQFVSKDLTLVNQSDLLIAYLPRKVPTTGTVHEIIVSNQNKRPTLLMCPQGKKYIPKWYRGFIKREHTFGSWEEIYAFLDAVVRGDWKDHKRWRFIYGTL